MATATRTLSPADQAAHELASYVRPRRVLYRVPAGGPRGSWPADEFARDRRKEGVAAVVIMSMRDDAFLVIVRPEAEVEVERWRCPHCDVWNTEAQDPERCHCCDEPRQAVAS